MSTATASKSTAAARQSKALVEFMPGRTLEVPAYEVGGVPKFVVARLVRQGNGTYALIPQQWSQQVRLTQLLCNEMGIQCNRRVIYNLIRAGLVKGTMISPRNTMVDLLSLVEHIQRCRIGAGKPVYWTKARIEKYRFASISAVEECEDDEAGLD